MVAVTNFLRLNKKKLVSYAYCVVKASLFLSDETCTFPVTHFCCL